MIYIQPKKHSKVPIIGILEEIDSFYWPKMHLWKGAKKNWAGPPPLIWTKSKRTATFFRDGVPYFRSHSLAIACLIFWWTDRSSGLFLLFCHIHIFTFFGWVQNFNWSYLSNSTSAVKLGKFRRDLNIRNIKTYLVIHILITRKHRKKAALHKLSGKSSSDVLSVLSVLSVL